MDKTEFYKDLKPLNMDNTDNIILPMQPLKQKVKYTLDDIIVHGSEEVTKMFMISELRKNLSKDEIIMLDDMLKESQ